MLVDKYHHHANEVVQVYIEIFTYVHANISMKTMPSINFYAKSIQFRLKRSVHDSDYSKGASHNLNHGPMGAKHDH